MVLPRSLRSASSTTAGLRERNAGMSGPLGHAPPPVSRSDGSKGGGIFWKNPDVLPRSVFYVLWHNNPLPLFLRCKLTGTIFLGQVSRFPCRLSREKHRNHEEGGVGECLEGCCLPYLDCSAARVSIPLLQHEQTHTTSKPENEVKLEENGTLEYYDCGGGSRFNWDSS
ncbi:hypothetical protein GN956_G8993 [Arapaima gigas]